MKRFLASGVFIILGLLSASLTGQQSPVNDWLIVPGVRIGPLRANAMRSDVKRLFPNATVEERELELDEGMVFPATMVSQSIPSESLAIVWNGKDASAHPKQVFLCRGRRGGPCKWHAEGIGGEIAAGMRLTDLEAMNNGPFTVQGFGPGYGGNVLSWDGGRFEKLDCSRSLSIAVDGERNREGQLTLPLTPAERQSFTGNRPIPSGTPALRKLNPAVTEIVFVFPAPGSKPCG